MQAGVFEGDVCGRDGCQGIIVTHEVEDCSCHINPPCSSCTTPRQYCMECGWEAANDPEDYRESGVVKQALVYIPSVPRRLDNTKIDYYIIEHTNSTQKCVGVYPDGTRMDEIRKVVNGTFGGRFESCANGRFVFIAYTD
jgi:hypothetical protein